MFEEVSIKAQLNTFLHEKGSLRLLMPDSYRPDNFLLVVNFAIFTTKNFKDFEHIAGHATLSGFREGAPDISLFGFINGMLASPESKTKLWLADTSNSCIREINRIDNQTTTFAGFCSNTASVDGDVAVAKFGYPISLAQHPERLYSVYFFDNIHIQLKVLEKTNTSWEVRTVYNWDKRIKSLAFDVSGSILYFVLARGLAEMLMYIEEPKIELVFETYEGNSDGALNVFRDESTQAMVRELRDVVFLDNHLGMLVDHGNSQIRLIDLETFEMSSVCQMQTSNYEEVPGDISKCRIVKPIKLTKQKGDNSKIFIYNQNTIYEFAIKGKLIYHVKYINIYKYI